MRLASFFLKLEILLPIRSVGPNSDHITFNIFLRAQSRLSLKVTGRVGFGFPTTYLAHSAQWVRFSKYISLSDFLQRSRGSSSPHRSVGVPGNSQALLCASCFAPLQAECRLRKWKKKGPATPTRYRNTDEGIIPQQGGIQRVWSIPNVAYDPVYSAASSLASKKQTNKQTKPMLLAF